MPEAPIPSHLHCDKTLALPGCPQLQQRQDHGDPCVTLARTWPSLSLLICCRVAQRLGSALKFCPAGRKVSAPPALRGLRQAAQNRVSLSRGYRDVQTPGVWAGSSLCPPNPIPPQTEHMPYPLAGTGLWMKSRGTSQPCCPLACPPPQQRHLIVGLGAGSWFPAGPAFAGRWTMSQPQASLNSSGDGGGAVLAGSHPAGWQVGDGSCSRGCEASSFQGKGPPERGQGGAPGSWKPTTGNHIRDTLWGRGIS